MNEVNFFVKSGTFFIGGSPIDFPYPVDDVLVCGDLFLVRIAPPVGVVFNRNVFAVSSEGRMLWQIAERPHGTQGDSPYINIYFDGGGRLIAGNWNGVDYFVDLASGDVSVCQFSK